MLDKEETIERIRSFANLEKNWDSYNADPIDPKVIERAVRVIEILSKLAFPVPTSGGDISFEWYDGDDDISFTISPERVEGFYISIKDWESEIGHP
jgi:hypothetical protein